MKLSASMLSAVLIPAFTLTLATAPARASVLQPDSLLGQQAPSFSLPALKGAAQSLAAMRGKFLVVHFTAGW